MQRAAIGFSIALVIGVMLGATGLAIARAARRNRLDDHGPPDDAVDRVVPARDRVVPVLGGAIYFVVVLGAAPSIANGIIGGVDHIQPVLLRAGRVMGARRWSNLRHVVLPAALPSFVGGLKQGWAFAWRSLLAGELLVLVSGKPTLGGLLDINRQVNDYEALIAVMIVILVIGIVIDSLIFGTLDKRIRRRYGLIDEATH